MATRSAASTTGATVKKILWYTLLAGVVVALLKVFDWDPFGIVDWIFSIVTTVVDAISNFLFHNETFRKITSAP